MTRSQLRIIINQAHDALHGGDVDVAHELLHAGIGEVESMTSDAEVQDAVTAFLRYAEGILPCGHTIGDLVSGLGMITQCGACRLQHQTSKANREPKR